MKTQFNRYTKSVLALIFAFAVVAANLSVVQAAANPDISGHWVSSSCEVRPAGNGQQNHIKRDFQNGADGTWKGTFPIYADAACSQLNLTFYSEGTYKFGDPSATVAGATETYFSFDVIKVTPHAAGIVDYLNSAGAGKCGAATWQADVEQDLSVGGCTVLGVDRQNCAGEYDLTKVEGDKLYYGARPEDGGFLCTPAQRPSALQVAVIRADASNSGQMMPQTGAADLPQYLWLLAIVAVFTFSVGVAMRRTRKV